MCFVVRLPQLEEEDEEGVSLQTVTISLYAQDLPNGLQNRTVQEIGRDMDRR